MLDEITKMWTQFKHFQGQILQENSNSIHYCKLRRVHSDLFNLGKTSRKFPKLVRQKSGKININKFRASSMPNIKIRNVKQLYLRIDFELFSETGSNQIVKRF